MYELDLVPDLKCCRAAAAFEILRALVQMVTAAMKLKDAYSLEKKL